MAAEWIGGERDMLGLVNQMLKANRITETGKTTGSASICFHTGLPPR